MDSLTGASNGRDFFLPKGLGFDCDEGSPSGSRKKEHGNKTLSFLPFGSSRPYPIDDLGSKGKNVPNLSGSVTERKKLRSLSENESRISRNSHSAIGTELRSNAESLSGTLFSNPSRGFIGKQRSTSEKSTPHNGGGRAESALPSSFWFDSAFNLKRQGPALTTLAQGSAMQRLFRSKDATFGIEGQRKITPGAATVTTAAQPISTKEKVTNSNDVRVVEGRTSLSSDGVSKYKKDGAAIITPRAAPNLSPSTSRVRTTRGRTDGHRNRKSRKKGEQTRSISTNKGNEKNYNAFGKNQYNTGRGGGRKSRGGGRYGRRKHSAPLKKRYIKKQDSIISGTTATPSTRAPVGENHTITPHLTYTVAATTTPKEKTVARNTVRAASGSAKDQGPRRNIPKPSTSSKFAANTLPNNLPKSFGSQSTSCAATTNAVPLRDGVSASSSYSREDAALAGRILSSSKSSSKSSHYSRRGPWLTNNRMGTGVFLQKGSSTTPPAGILTDSSTSLITNNPTASTRQQEGASAPSGGGGGGRGGGGGGAGASKLIISSSSKNKKKKKKKGESGTAAAPVPSSTFSKKVSAKRVNETKAAAARDTGNIGVKAAAAFWFIIIFNEESPDSSETATSSE
eukprot:jgi/Bigna1/136554/aug1.34_g11262